MTARELAAQAMRNAKWTPHFVDDFLEGRQEAPAVLALAEEVRQLRDRLGYYHP